MTVNEFVSRLERDMIVTAGEEDPILPLELLQELQTTARTTGYAPPQLLTLYAAHSLVGIARWQAAEFLNRDGLDREAWKELLHATRH